MNYKIIDQLKVKLDKYRPLSNEILTNLVDDLIVKWTYNSNAIEGNTLTLQETKVVLSGITIGGKTMIEHLEAINHKNAILFIQELTDKNNTLTELDVKQIHTLVLKNINDQNAGSYRKTNVIISGAEHKPVEFFKVAQKMADFIDSYPQNQKKMHPVELAARVHIDFVGIHPFIDGNGRTARLLMNLELLKAGFPPIVIKVADRLEYYQALDLAHTKQDYQPFMNLTIKAVERSFEPYFYVLGEKLP
ncbi:Fic domain protein, MA2133 type [uncultured Gammaproteobacteria bacterium]|jgi:Fic family protein|nr:Fic domain protein, MA2133 type [Bathymodiolus brooksi thiotrophic gill symbiont]CAC9543917.1 Fic domain protein, MA2133 type [uncultured Gammaproteobacteria bacterium]CAC9553942.1 Fic domain protein, MA2133 type [uncultured Gammaproteobacteria bacterium]CAC9587039.1 Fic domain protein, MA2133 type [uncultured Gammaproteobacteria bacterium]CAC9600907.1 Fic domain protein, MA2133 type [uncultured Gammaproteobacteria bacterium]